MKKYFILLILPLLLGATTPELRGVKLTNVDSNVLFSDQSIANAMDYLASIGINTVLTVVWNSSSADGDHTLYPSRVMEDYFGSERSIHPSFRNRDPLERVIIEAHRNGIEVLPWFEMGFSTSYSKAGGFILQQYPSWALKNNDGNLVVKNGFDWMSAVNPDVQDFIHDLTVEVAENYDIDGIEYSDRIPAMPVEGGYDSITVQLYRDEHNGQYPPANYKDPNWKRWRANKLNAFFTRVRQSVKTISPHIFVSSSPSLYPWSYEEYLQDSKTWMEQGIADNIIPQVYRYDLANYLFELDRSLNNFPQHQSVYFPGMLIKSGSYVIDSDYFMDAIAGNRKRNINGEVFFFYEGLRANNNHLGDTLKANYYAEAAPVPGRNGNTWRPEATIVNEDDPGITATGSWTTSTIEGFKAGIKINSDPAHASLTYAFDVPFEAWFDVYAYIVTGPLASKQVAFTIYNADDSTLVVRDQTDIYQGGWRLLSSVYLEKGQQDLLKLDNRNLQDGEKLTADAAMIMINRKCSPDVFCTGIDKSRDKHILPSKIHLSQNYPNPFNTGTVIDYQLSKGIDIDLSVYNLLGQKIETLTKGYQEAGTYQIEWDASRLASGVYYYYLRTAERNLIRRMILLK